MSEYIVFAKRVSLIGAVKFIGSLRGLILLPILAKTLGAANYGIWAQILITVGLLMSFVMFGLPLAMVRFLPAEKEKKNTAKGIFTVIFTVLFISTIFSLLLFLFSDLFASALLKNPSASILIKITAFLVILEALNQTSLESFRIFGQIKRYSILTISQTFLEIGLILPLVLSGFGLFGALIALLIARIIILLFSLLFIILRVGFSLPDFSILKPYLTFTLPLVPFGLLDIFITSSDRYIIGFFKGAASVGIYSATYSLGLLAGVFIYPIIYILTPTIFKLFDEGKIDKVKMYLSYSLKYFFLFSIPSVFGLAVLVGPVLTILATSEFVSSSSVLIVLLVSLGAVLYGVQAIIGLILMFFKKTKFFLLAFGVAATVNLGLNIAFVFYWGILGAAITTLIAYIIIALIVAWKSRQYMKFRIDLNFIVKSILASLLMVGLIFIFNPIGITKILLAIGIGVIIYFCALSLLRGFSREELKIISETLKLDKIYERLQ